MKVVCFFILLLLTMLLISFLNLAYSVMLVYPMELSGDMDVMSQLKDIYQNDVKVEFKRMINLEAK